MIYRTFLLALLFPLCSYAQFGKLFEKSDLPAKKMYDVSIIDSTYGITLFEKLCAVTGGDSTRNCNGYACNGWIEDFYKNGQLLHKGYYQQGQIKNYKNFYPDGKLEREVKSLDDYRCSLRSFYPSGQVKSYVEFRQTVPYKWTDYYENGQPEFIEEYNKKGEYYIKRQSFFPDGKPETALELINSKQMIYGNKEFYENGNIKEEGQVIFSFDMMDYLKNGVRKIYTADGKLKSEQTYINGIMNSEKTF